MEIRLLDKNGIPYAAGVAAEVYHAFVFPFTRTPFEAEEFRQYTDINHLWNEVRHGRLFLWGIFEDGGLCAVGAMQNVGHITMLYVRLPYQRRGFGALLLYTMRDFAFFRLNEWRVTANVFPFQIAPFFEKRGFCRIPGMGNQNRFLSLECRRTVSAAAMQIPQPYPGNISYRSNPGVIYVQYPYTQAPKKKAGVTYTTKKVSTKAILLLVFVTLALCFLVGIGFAVCHIALDGVFSLAFLPGLF